ncbi:Hypothetical predicted protein [Lecanosticta acicola]|uniref:Uncharacterized protein n=1 Tax=Lecanosticta acicola TaxID=111012 RepID=A0AAI8Z7D6_9PEZI|nr:Hypothetical predicted protein [Lecanosticta acicola]
MDDYEYDGDGFDYDDGWIYVDDEFNTADELAEGQIASPGYTGTNHELSMDGYEYDLYQYWDDVEYGDDPYWEYGLPNKKDESAKKRKRVPRMEGPPPKRRKTTETTVEDEKKDGEPQPMLFMSRQEQNRRSLAQPPLLKSKDVSALLPDWRQRFEDADGVTVAKKMPAAMKAAAEAQGEDTPLEKRQIGAHYAENGVAQGDEDDWEDDEEADEDVEDDGEISLDPEMLQTILREKLGAAGLEGADEAGFMQAIQQMMSGEGEGDATGDLANALLGKLTSQGGDEVLSGWLSQQGVSLEEDDASSMATEELPNVPAASAASRRNLQNLPPDSVVGFSEGRSSGRKTTQMPLHSGSSSASSKKRGAPSETAKPEKKQKKVQFDVPPSSSSDALQDDSTLDEPEPPTIEDPLMSKSTLKDSASKSRNANAAATPAHQAASEKDAATGKDGRKRKACSPDGASGQPEKKKKTRSRELQSLGPLPDAPSPAPPAKRTRSAKDRARKE